QNAWPFLAITLRSHLEQAALLSAVQREVQALDPTLPVFNVRTMDEVMAQSLATRRLILTLFSLFAVIALLLAAVGVYGVLAFAVTQRTRELGIRMALGATVHDILRLVVGQGMKLVLMGIVIGISAAFALNGLISKLLFGVSSTDPLTFAMIASLLTIVT